MVRRFKGPPGPLLTSHQSSDLDGLTTGSYALGSGTDWLINNTGERLLELHCELILSSFTPGTDPHVSLFYRRSNNGTDFEDPPTAVAPPAGMPMVVREIFAGATAKRIIYDPIGLTPGWARLLLGNLSGQTFATGGNSLKYYITSLDR